MNFKLVTQIFHLHSKRNKIKNTIAIKYHKLSNKTLLDFSIPFTISKNNIKFVNLVVWLIVLIISVLDLKSRHFPLSFWSYFLKKFIENAYARQFFFFIQELPSFMSLLQLFAAPVNHIPLVVQISMPPCVQIINVPSSITSMGPNHLWWLVIRV